MLPPELTETPLQSETAAAVVVVVVGSTTQGREMKIGKFFELVFLDLQVCVSLAISLTLPLSGTIRDDTNLLSL